MFLEVRQYSTPAPIISEHFVPLECGPCLVSDGKGGALWVEKPSKSSTVRVAPSQLSLKDSWLLECATEKLGGQLEVDWSELNDLGDGASEFLQGHGWDSPRLLTSREGLWSHSGLQVDVVSFLPKGVAVLMESNRGLLGCHHTYTDGSSFYFHPLNSLRVLHVG